jgi:putative intracellular protease/amidase
VKPRVCLLAFDGLADWEPAYALCEINKSGKFDVLTVGFAAEPIITMAGLRLVPDTTLGAMDWADAALLILPGGEMWESGPAVDINPLLQNLHKQNVAIAAICGATLQLARAGLIRGRRHTSNSLDYLKAMVPGYRHESLYVNELAVTDGSLITASGLGSVEFARDILRYLRIYNDEDMALWFDMFKRGLLPEAHRSKGSGN